MSLDDAVEAEGGEGPAVGLLDTGARHGISVKLNTIQKFENFFTQKVRKCFLLL